MENENPESHLNERQLKFAKLYVSEDFYGNGVKAYCEAYGLDRSDPKQYNTAKSNASDLLTNPYIIAVINKELDDAGLNNNHVDKQLLFAINQSADIGSKVAAIREYNKLRQRITEKVEAKISGDINITMKIEP